MKKVFNLLNIFVAVIGLSFLLSGCGGAQLSPELQASIESSQIMHTQRNMRMNLAKGGQQTVDTTNYGVGILIPVNSEIKILKVTSSTVVFAYNNIEVVLINKAKYTGIDMQQTVERYFASNKVNLANFNKVDMESINTAEIKVGVSKEALLISRGFPPAHATVSTEVDTWRYWQTRWNTILVNFKNNKVQSITE